MISIRNFLYIFCFKGYNFNTYFNLPHQIVNGMMLKLSGVALLSIGVWVLLDQFTYISYFLSSWYKGLTCLTLSCGGLVILVTFIGCSGAKLSNSGCLGLVSEPS